MIRRMGKALVGLMVLVGAQTALGEIVAHDVSRIITAQVREADGTNWHESATSSEMVFDQMVEATGRGTALMHQATDVVVGSAGLELSGLYATKFTSPVAGSVERMSCAFHTSVSFSVARQGVYRLELSVVDGISPWVTLTDSAADVLRVQLHQDTVLEGGLEAGETYFLQVDGGRDMDVTESIDEASGFQLVFQAAETGPVSVQSLAWSRIKALYR